MDTEWSFGCVGTDHKLAGVSFREVFALDEKEVLQSLGLLQEIHGIRDVLIISTCHRTEVFYSSVQKDAIQEEKIIKILCLVKGVPYQDSLKDSFFFLRDKEETVRRLFRISIGLESGVLGDVQISGQVKNSYRISVEASHQHATMSAALHRLMHTIFYTHKCIAQETSFHQGAVSVPAVAVDWIENMFSTEKKPNILVVGMGKIGQDICRNLSRISAEVAVTNRTQKKAEHMSKTWGFKLIDYKQIKKQIAQTDVLISCVQRKEPLWKRNDFLSKENQCRYVLDLSVPRSVEPNVAKVSGILLHNVDDLLNATAQTLNERQAEVRKVEELLEDGIKEFLDWEKEHKSFFTIQKLKQAFEKLRQEEMSRHLKSCTSKEKKKIDQVTRGLLQRILKYPAIHMKEACRRGEAEELDQILRNLFDLEKVQHRKT
ncbi:MAG: glutamyl-tRNA reductase [Cytophagales bacterium]|nr:glutamyl-tRNA reductase [Cytophagales bacterium]